MKNFGSALKRKNITSSARAIGQLISEYKLQVNECIPQFLFLQLQELILHKVISD